MYKAQTQKLLYHKQYRVREKHNAQLDLEETKLSTVYSCSKILQKYKVVAKSSFIVCIVIHCWPRYTQFNFPD